MDTLKFEAFYTKLLEYAIEGKYKEELELAKRQFFLEDDESDFIGFTEWFVFNYRHSTKKKTLAQLYMLEHPEESIQSIHTTLRSIFELREENKAKYLIDLFSGMHYKISDAALNPEMIHCLRIIENGDVYEIVGDMFEYDLVYKEVIKRYVLDQFNQMNTLEHPVGLDVFINQNNHLLFKLHSVLESIYEDNVMDELFDLHQATYAFKGNHDSLIEALDHTDLVIYPDEEDENIFKCMLQDEWVAEIEFVDQKMFLLCNNANHLKLMLSIIKQIQFNDLIFLSQNVISVDELLD